MATVTITVWASARGSGSSSYSQYTSVLHLGGGYRCYLKFPVSVPEGATITAVRLYMSHSSSTTAATQSVKFETSSSSGWSHTATATYTTTSRQDSGNRYYWIINNLASAIQALGGSCNLHLSTTSGTDRPYDGTMSKCYLQITYEETPVPPPPTSRRTMHRWNGSAWVACDAYRWDGSAWVRCDAHRYDGGGWD